MATGKGGLVTGPVRQLSCVICGILLVILTGCIQPVSTADLTQTAIAPFVTPNAPVASPVIVPANPTVPPAPAGAATVPTPGPDVLIQQFVQSQGDGLPGIQVWYDQLQGPDRLQGFSYIHPSGVPCAGFLLAAFVNGNWQTSNGARVCAESPATEALAAVTFVLTSDGQPYTIVFGRVENPTITAIAAIFDDNSSQQTSPINGGYLLVKPGVVGVRVITAINAEGNTVLPNIPQSPV